MRADSTRTLRDEYGWWRLAAEQEDCAKNSWTKREYVLLIFVFFFQAEDGIRDRSPSRGLGDVYKRQDYSGI